MTEGSLRTARVPANSRDDVLGLGVPSEAVLALTNVHGHASIILLPQRVVVATRVACAAGVDSIALLDTISRVVELEWEGKRDCRRAENEKRVGELHHIFLGFWMQGQLEIFGIYNSLLWL